MGYPVIEIEHGHKIWGALLEAATTIGEATVRQLTMEMDWIKADHVLVAVSDGQPVGLLRLVTQRLGEDEDRPPIIFRGETLIEGKVISFGVVPECRNQGIGRALQEKAVELAREEGCYQLRSRSWYHAQANFHLKISMGSGIQPSLKDDSVYFMIVL